MNNNFPPILAAALGSAVMAACIALFTVTYEIGRAAAYRDCIKTGLIVIRGELQSCTIKE